MFKSLLVAITAVVSMTSVAAYDDRYLVHKPKCTTMDEFEANWKGYCPYFAPALAANQTGGYAFFNRGDYMGKNNDTQALVYCVFKNQTGRAPVQYTLPLVKTLGAYQITGDN